MKLSKRISIFFATALVAVSSGLFGVDGRVYAQTTEEVPETLKIEPLPEVKPEVKVPEVKTDNGPLNISVLKENEPVIEEKTEIISEKSDVLQKTTQEVKTIEEKKQSLVNDLTSKKNEIEVLKVKVAEKKARQAELATIATSVGGRGAGEATTANPNGCNTETQWIRADNQQCKNKTDVSTTSSPSTPSRVYAGNSAGNTYQAGQCTWHVKNLRPDLPNSLGNADTWYQRAQALGLATGTTAQAGAAAPRKTGMHVVYVVEVYGNGTMLVSEMNYNYSPYSQRTYIKNQADFYYIY